MMDQILVSLKRELIEYSDLVSSMIGKSFSGVEKKDINLLKQVIENDEPVANYKEIQIDELCTEIIAQHEPKAKNLRMVLMVLKINNDLERMGDHAVNIAECGLVSVNDLPLPRLKELSQMMNEAKRMMMDANKSFIDEDAHLAREIGERDCIVDDLNEENIRALIEMMTCDSAAVDRAMTSILISRNIERIADLSTNIAEDVLFMVSGLVTKHHAAENADTEAGPHAGA